MYESSCRRLPGLIAGLLALSLPLLAQARGEPTPSENPFSNNLIVAGHLPGATRLELQVLESKDEPLALTLVDGRLQAGISVAEGEGRRLALRATNADGKLVYDGEVELDVNADLVPEVIVEFGSSSEGMPAELSIASHRLEIEYAGVERDGALFTRVTATAFDANGRRVPLEEGEIRWGGLVPELQGHLLDCPVSHGGTSLCAEFLPEKFRDPVKFDACFRDKICGWQPAPPVPPMWRTVAVGLGGHACALKLNGELYCWGQGEQGQLGYVAPKECTVSGAAGNLWGCSGMPGLVMCAGAPCHFIEVTAGLRHTCALDTNQDAWCWGDNFDGQLGLNFFDTTTKGSPEPRRVVGGLKFKSIRAGFSMTCGLSITHQVYCWGKNSLAVIPALADGWANDPRLVPTPEAISDIDLSWSHVCGQVTNGHLYCWGSNWKAELGSLSFPTAPTCATCPGMPLLMQANIPSLANQQVSLMSVGSNGSCAHLASGGTTCWGTTLPAFPGGRSLERLSRGMHHYCAISRGNMECAGAAALGDGSETHPLPGVGPVAVKPAKNYRELDTGNQATCAIAADENVYCWGNTTFAQLGLGQPNGFVTSPTALLFPSTLKIPPKHWWQP